MVDTSHNGLDLWNPDTYRQRIVSNQIIPNTSLFMCKILIPVISTLYLDIIGLVNLSHGSHLPRKGLHATSYTFATDQNPIFHKKTYQAEEEQFRAEKGSPC